MARGAPCVAGHGSIDFCKWDKPLDTSGLHSGHALNRDGYPDTYDDRYYAADERAPRWLVHRLPAPPAGSRSRGYCPVPPRQVRRRAGIADHPMKNIAELLSLKWKATCAT